MQTAGAPSSQPHGQGVLRCYKSAQTSSCTQQPFAAAVVGLSESGWLASRKVEHRLATGRGGRLHYETYCRCAVWVKRLAHLGAA